jgi:hypothetical protein
MVRSLKQAGGHGTDVAIHLGLAGCDPVAIDESTIPGIIETLRENKSLEPGLSIIFDPVEIIGRCRCDPWRIRFYFSSQKCLLSGKHQ